tara:strand:- start:671 stop:883 length:213 start_codon:yes stop_codon:yes gene_type:complete
MRNLIIAALVLFLLYTNSTFRSYTIKGLQSISNFINELPKELPGESNNDNGEAIKDNEEEEILNSGSSTY